MIDDEEDRSIFHHTLSTLMVCYYIVNKSMITEWANVRTGQTEVRTDN